VEVLTAQAERVVARVGEARSRRPLARHEHVAVPFVVQDPADVPLEVVVEVVILQVRQAPDPLARVVEIAGAALAGPPVGIDDDRRGRWDRGGSRGRGSRLRPAPRRPKGREEEERRSRAAGR